MLNLLVLMSGGDETFRSSGYVFPKNLVEIDGAPLVRHVIDGFTTLRPLDVRVICMIRKEEARVFHTHRVVRLLDPGAMVLDVNGETSGAACTALLAISEIDNDSPLVIANGDIVLEADLGAIVRGFFERELDGGVVVFRDVHPRWSFVRAGEDGLLVEVAEKRPISDLATAGIYYYARGREFVAAASAMMLKEAHLDGQYYICPGYNEMILKGLKVGYAEVDRAAYHSLKLPRDVRAYEELMISRRLLKRGAING